MVLDLTMGSGSTGLACVNTKRKFIGIERDDKYFEIATNELRKTNIICLMFKRTTAINKILSLKKRIKGIQGGTSAGKTFGILPVLINRAIQTPNLEISVLLSQYHI